MTATPYCNPERKKKEERNREGLKAPPPQGAPGKVVVVLRSQALASCLCRDIYRWGNIKNWVVGDVF